MHMCKNRLVSPKSTVQDIMDEGTKFWLVLGFLAVVAWLIDRIPQRGIDWTNQAASQDDVSKIVAGKQRQQPRHLLKLTLLLVVVLVLWWLVA